AEQLQLPECRCRPHPPTFKFATHAPSVIADNTAAKPLSSAAFVPMSQKKFIPL
ncbi:hypothetical protein CCACVL1_01910, partial [Corchorus capsularis]